MRDIEQKLLGDVDAILGPDGLLQQRGTHLRYSRHQHEYARRAAQGFTRFDKTSGKAAINMLQAATGTGKTLGYLVPLMLFAAYGKGEVSRVAVSTYTRHLQKQILSQDAITAAGLVAARTGVTLTVAPRLGIGNYVSATAAARLYDTLASQDDRCFAEALEFLDDLIEWAGERGKDGKPANSGLLYDFIVEHELDRLPFGVELNTISLDHADDEDEKAAYMAMIEASKDADVLVVNHALLVTNAVRWSALLDDPDKRPISALVCDEADRLPDAAESVTGTGLALHGLVNACRYVCDEKGIAAAARLQEFVNSLKIPPASIMPISDRSELAAHLRATFEILRPAATAVAATISADSAMDVKAKAEGAAFLDAMQDLEATLAVFQDPESTALISWSPVRDYPSLRIGRPNPGRLLSRMWSLRRDANAESATAPPLRAYLDAVLMTSATLETPGCDLPRAFDDFASSVGIVRHLSKRDSKTPVHNVTVDLFARYEPAKFGSAQFVLAAPDAPSPTVQYDDESWDTSAEWLNYAASMVRAAHAEGGRTLVLSLSWADTAEIGRRLSDMNGLIVHERGRNLREVLNGFMAAANAVLVTPSGWEGVDLPGMVQQLVISRIPFAPADNGMEMLRRIHFEHLGFSKDKIESIIFSDRETRMRRKLIQGIGRGIRSDSDSCTIWIADPRFPLPEPFRDSLDPVLMDAPARHQRPVLRFCIPHRFRVSTYAQARLFLTNGRIHTLSDV